MQGKPKKKKGKKKERREKKRKERKKRGPLTDGGMSLGAKAARYRVN